MNHPAKDKQAVHEERSQEVDPVCGMAVNPATAVAVVGRDGRKYYFCSHDCEQRFISNPGAYISKSSTEPARPGPDPGDAEYTCPMHPQIVRPDPAFARSVAWR